MEIKKHQLKPIPRQVTTIGTQDDIFISIEIGNGQIGGNKVSSNDTLLAKGNLTQPTFIGNAAGLKGSEIEIETNVLDVNAFTNVCVITTTFLNQENKVLFTTIDKGDAPENGIASFKGKYILRILTILIFIFCGFNIDLNAQNTADDISFQNLETPSSPGFILLDEAPSSIEKPTTPQGFGLSLLGFFQGTGGAIEFAPFWLSVHPELTAEIMYNNKFPVLYNLSISVATIENENSNFLAGGLRTRLFQKYSKQQTEKLALKKQEIEDSLSVSPEDLNLEKIEELRQEYVGITEKPIFNIDFATALGGGSTTNSFNDLELNRWAVWLSFNWRPKGDDFYFTALSRYINNEKYEEYIVNADLIDLGTRLNYDISKFCLSLEYLHRINATENEFDDYRIAIIGSYNISENFFITSTFGKNFTDVNNIIALAGINFGFSRSKVKAFGES